jgi:hypothetical protein
MIEEDLKPMPSDNYNLISYQLRSYQNEITPYEAFADEIAQNFFDSAKSYIEERKRKGKSAGKPRMTIHIRPDHEDGPSFIIHQTGTTGIVNRGDYAKYGATQKDQDLLAAGSQGVGWKIWLLICDRVETETIVNRQYYQTYQKTIGKQILVKHESGEWSKADIDFSRGSVRHSGDTYIKFINVKSSEGFIEDGKNYFDEISQAWEKIIFQRYFWALKRYDTIKIKIVRPSNTKSTLNVVDLSYKGVTYLEYDIEKSSYKTLEKKEFPDPKIISGLKDEDSFYNDIPIGTKSIRYGIMQDIRIAYTSNKIKDLREGIAIIVRDRVIEWYNPRRRHVGSPGVDGILFGQVICNYLHRKDNMTHDSLSDNFPDVRLTREKLRDLIKRLYNSILDLQNPELLESTYSNNVITQINDALKEYLDEQELLAEAFSTTFQEDPGNSVTDIPEFPESNIKIKDLIVFEKTNSGDLVELSDDILDPDKEYQGKLIISNLDIENKSIDLKIHIPKIFNYTAEMILAGNDLTESVFDISLPTDVKRGNISIISSINFNHEIIKNSFKFLIKPLVMNIKANPIRVIRGNDVEIEYDILRSLFPGIRILYAVLYNSENNPILEEGPYNINRSASDKSERFSIPIKSSYPRGSYKFELTLKSGSNVIQFERKIFLVEPFINKINISQKNVKYNEKFEIYVELKNSTLNVINSAILYLKVENDDLFELQRDLVIDLEPNETKTFKFKDLIVDEQSSPGKYSALISFKLPTDNIPEKKGITFYVEQDTIKKKSTGMFKDIKFLQNERDGIKDKNLAILVNNVIKVNTFHYLFRKIENEDGLDLQTFKELVMQAIWFALRDRFKKQGIFEEMWEFEEAMLSKKKIGGIFIE